MNLKKTALTGLAALTFCMQSCTGLETYRTDEFCRGDRVCNEIKDKKFQNIIYVQPGIAILEKKYCKITPYLPTGTYENLGEGNLESIVNIMKREPDYIGFNVKEVDVKGTKIPENYLVEIKYLGISGKTVPETRFYFVINGDVYFTTTSLFESSGGDGSGGAGGSGGGDGGGGGGGEWAKKY